MKASELVQALNVLIEEHGDKMVYYMDKDDSIYPIRSTDTDFEDDFILKQEKD